MSRHYSGEMENVHIICSKFIQETLYQILSESPKFYRRYYEQIFGFIFFWAQCSNQWWVLL